MSDTRIRVIAVVSDLHANSSIGMCPSEGVRLGEGGYYHPSKVQLWMWERYAWYWERVKETVKRHKAVLIGVCNGDAVDGPTHHGTTQVISVSPEVQTQIAMRCFDHLFALKPSQVFVVRGTEEHTGPGASDEEALARSLAHVGPIVRDPHTELWSYWELFLDIHGLRLDFKHHGRSGGRPWTRQNSLSTQAAEIFMTETLLGRKPPRIAVRSHAHVPGDSYDAFPVRLIQTPAWQVKTSYVHKRFANAICSIGGLILTIHPDQRIEVDMPTWHEDQTPAIRC